MPPHRVAEGTVHEGIHRTLVDQRAVAFLHETRGDLALTKPLDAGGLANLRRLAAPRGGHLRSRDRNLETAQVVVLPPHLDIERLCRGGACVGFAQGRFGSGSASPDGRTVRCAFRESRRARGTGRVTSRSAKGGIRTPTARGHQLLRLARLPIPPLSRTVPRTTGPAPNSGRNLATGGEVGKQRHRRPATPPPRPPTPRATTAISAPGRRGSGCPPAGRTGTGGSGARSPRRPVGVATRYGRTRCALGSRRR